MIGLVLLVYPWIDFCSAQACSSLGLLPWICNGDDGSVFGFSQTTGLNLSGSVLDALRRGLRLARPLDLAQVVAMPHRTSKLLCREMVRLCREMYGSFCWIKQMRLWQSNCGLHDATYGKEIN